MPVVAIAELGKHTICRLLSTHRGGTDPDRSFDGPAVHKANGFDCGNYVKDPEPGLGTREGGTCNWNGKDVTVTVFAGSNSQVKELVNAFKGLSQGYIMLRSNWAFSIEDPETARTLSSLLNMEIL